jgi:penicillin-binding protein 1A
MRTRRRLLALLSSLAVIPGGCALPQLSDYTARELAQTSFLYAADGSLITEFHAVEDRVVLTADELPQTLRDAAVAIEDRRFYQHHGIDLQAIMRAAYVNTASGTVVEGGSTITQQLVKRLYLEDEETFRRKFDEAALAWQLEDRWSKDEILTEYLNTVYFGQGAYGAQAAAQTYFGIDAKDLNLAQSAMLAGLIAAPNHFDPYVRPQAARGRRDVVLELMHRLGAITAEQLDRATARPIRVQRGSERQEQRYPFPYFVDYFTRWFLAEPAFGRTREDRARLLFGGGLRITTTLDPQLQEAAEDAVSSVLAYPGDPAAALTVVDPLTGFVRAMVGGKDEDFWAERRGGRVNLATGAGGTGRQTGSAFKPFALVAALEHGIAPDTVFPAPSSIRIPLKDGQVWDVTNAEGGGYGSMSLESATIYSVNTVYAQLIVQLGPDTVVRTAERLGIRCCTDVGEPRRPLRPYPSAVLGTNEVNTLEMASAFATLAAGGRRVRPVPAIEVRDADGDLLWRADPEPKQVVDPEVATAANDILEEAVRIGTGRAASIGRPQIGKTGTASDHTNAWFVGAIPQLAAAVWVGYPQGQIPMEPPRARITVFGGTWPAQIWRLLMARAIRGLPVRDFPSPEVNYVSVAVDITQRPLCLPNRFTLPQNIRILDFIQGTQPTQTCGSPTSLQEVTVPSVVGLRRSVAERRLEDAGFYVTVHLAPSTQPAGTVISQVPAAGTSALATSTITLTVADAGG